MAHDLVERRCLEKIMCLTILVEDGQFNERYIVWSNFGSYDVNTIHYYLASMNLRTAARGYFPGRINGR